MMLKYFSDRSYFLSKQSSVWFSSDPRPYELVEASVVEDPVLTIKEKINPYLKNQQRIGGNKYGSVYCLNKSNRR